MVTIQWHIRDKKDTQKIEITDDLTEAFCRFLSVRRPASYSGICWMKIESVEQKLYRFIKNRIAAWKCTVSHLLFFRAHASSDQCFSGTGQRTECLLAIRTDGSAGDAEQTERCGSDDGAGDGGNLLPSHATGPRNRLTDCQKGER